MSRSGFEPGMRSRRCQGGGGHRRGFQHPDQGGGEVRMYLRSGCEPGILCGDIREEEDVAAKYKPLREEVNRFGLSGESVAAFDKSQIRQFAASAQ
mgnify:CR=1 FL=1